MEIVLKQPIAIDQKTCTHKVRKRIRRNFLQKVFFSSKKRYVCQHCKKRFLA